MNQTHESLRQALSATEVHDVDVQRMLGEVNRRAASRRRWQRAGAAGALTVVAGAAAGVFALSPLTGSGQVGPTAGADAAATSASRQAPSLKLTSGRLSKVPRADDHVIGLVENQAGGATVELAMFEHGSFKLGDRANGEKVKVNGRTGYYNVKQAEAELAVEMEPDIWLVLSTPARFDTAKQALTDVASGVELIDESELPKEEEPKRPAGTR